MSARRGFWNYFWGLFGLHLHYFVINEKERERGSAGYWSYKRHFWHFYRITPVLKDGQWIEAHEKDVWQAHIELPLRKSPKDNWFAFRFHIGNLGSETPWDGHLTLFGWSWYWGHSGMRKLADRLTRCSGYKYDTRDWQLRIFDGKVGYSIAEHSDMCREYPRWRKNKKGKPRKNRRQGVLNLSIPEAIWGPYRYSYDDVSVHQTVLQMPEDGYAVILTLQRVFFGRTKVDKRKHIQSWSVDVDSPRGIPTHVDHSGGYKGDRTYGFGVKFYPSNGIQNWEEEAEVAVKAWVERERARTGFVKPDPVA